MIRHATPRTDPENVTDAGAFLDRLHDLCTDRAYDWASDTIEGIADTVMRTGRVTEGQLRAIDNIETAVAERFRTSWRR